MIFGILPFLIQWIALSQIGKLSNYHYSHSYSTIVPSVPSEGSGGDFVHNSLPPKSHWTLLNDFQRLNEEELEIFLPQLCNMILDDSFGGLSDSRIIDYFQQILTQKCSECLPFGIRVTNMLRVSLIWLSYLYLINHISCRRCSHQSRALNTVSSGRCF